MKHIGEEKKNHREISWRRGKSERASKQEAQSKLSGEPIGSNFQDSTKFTRETFQGLKEILFRQRPLFIRVSKKLYVSQYQNKLSHSGAEKHRNLSAGLPK